MSYQDLHNFHPSIKAGITREGEVILPESFLKGVELDKLLLLLAPHPYNRQEVLLGKFIERGDNREFQLDEDLEGCETYRLSINDNQDIGRRIQEHYKIDSGLTILIHSLWDHIAIERYS